MSVSLAKMWVETTLDIPGPGDDAIRILEQAANERVAITLLIGRGLTKRRRCYLVRWDGLEMLVIQLSKEQQQGWRVKATEMITELDTASMALPIVATSPEISISDVLVDGNLGYNGWEPFCGTCQFKYEERQQWAGENCALRIRYFHPGLGAQIAGMWYATGFLGSKEGSLRFRFPPLYSMNGKVEGLKGPLVVFLQMFTADNWQTQLGCRRISNVTSALINMK